MQSSSVPITYRAHYSVSIAQTSAKYTTIHTTGKIESYLAHANDLEKVLVQKWLICLDDSLLH